MIVTSALTQLLWRLNNVTYLSALNKFSTRESSLWVLLIQGIGPFTILVLKQYFRYSKWPPSRARRVNEHPLCCEEACRVYQATVGAEQYLWLMPMIKLEKLQFCMFKILFHCLGWNWVGESFCKTGKNQGDWFIEVRPGSHLCGGCTPSRLHWVSHCVQIQPSSHLILTTTRWGGRQ